MRTKRGTGGSPRRVRWWLALLIALVVAPVGFAAAKQAIFDQQQSPATGHAQVVTQGIAELPAGEVVWRVVERTARPRTEAQAGKRVLGFVLASDEPVLLTNVTAEGMKDVARLAPGESFLVEPGTRQIRASLSDQAVKYLSFELVPAADARDTNGGKLLFVSDPFTAPSGQRDIDLVRNVLTRGESATLPDTGDAVAILATEGAVDIIPGGGRSRMLEAGESAVFPAGELEIAAATPSASAGVRALADMTSSLQTDGQGRAAYVVAVIGPEIPPPPTATSAPPPPPPTPTPTAEPSPTIEVVPTGSISVTTWLCPPGMSMETLVGDVCQPGSVAMDGVLAGPDGMRGIGDAVALDTGWIWGDLPLGQYLFTATTLPEGFDSYFIPGSAAVGGSPESGYSVAIDESAPEIGLDLYLFAPATTGSIAVFVGLCPFDQSADDFDPASCAGATGGFDIGLLSTQTAEYFGLDMATFADGWVTWSGLALGDYSVVVNALPRGYDILVGPYGGQEVGTSFTVSITESQPGIGVPIYCFARVIT